MSRNITPVAELVARAKERITEISAQDAIGLALSDEVVIVDIRDVRERQKLGFIPNSFHAPRGMLEFWVDPQSPYHKEIFASEKQFILHCASGWRSALAAGHLLDMGFEVAHITEGFSGWVEAGGEVEQAEPR